MIEFAGIRSDEKYVVVEHYPKRKIPKRKYTVQSIPGRSGDLYIYEAEDAFENYDDTYTVFLDAKAPGLQEVSRGLAEWLLSPVGYQRLEDSYDPDTYRMAVYTGGEEFINVFNEYGRGSLKFNCAPKRFYKSGEASIQVASNVPIYSPSQFKSHPIVRITCPSETNLYSVQLNVTDLKTGSYTQFTMTAGGTVVIDTERKTATRLNVSASNYNSNVTSAYEALYLPNQFKITWSSANVSAVSIIPRWWTL